MLPLQTVFSQISIKTKVSINPTKNPSILNSTGAASSYYLPCGPYPEVEEISCRDIIYWEVLWYGDSSTIGLNQDYCETTCNGEVNYSNFFNVEFTEGIQYIRVHRYNSNIDEGTQLNGLTRSDQNKYMINFDQEEPVDTALVSCTVTGVLSGCVHTTNYIVVRPQFTLDIYYDSRIRYGEQSYIYIDALNQCGSINPSLPNSVTYSLSIISGSQYGRLLNSNTNDLGTTLEGINHDDGFLDGIEFVAEGTSPDSTVDVLIRVSTSDTQIQSQDLIIHIEPISEIIVLPTPSIIAPGDTADIELRKRMADGSLLNFAEGTLFDIWINSPDTDEIGII
ncbi:MAG: hypothetical protein P8X42_09815 [Calditrichaceae bacterium]